MGAAMLHKLAKNQEKMRSLVPELSRTGRCRKLPKADSFGYKGPVAHGALAGQRITMTTRFEDADFGPFKKGPGQPDHVGDWVMTPPAVAGVFNNQLTSALQQAGAVVPPTPAGADVIVHVVMTPTAGHHRLVWTQYETGKSMAMALIPLTHSNYFIQHDHILETISIEKAGHVVAQKTVRINADVPYKSSTLEGDSQEMDGLRIYRDQQAAGVRQALALLMSESGAAPSSLE